MLNRICAAMAVALSVTAAGCDQRVQSQPRMGAPPTVATKPLPVEAKSEKDASLPAANAAYAPQPRDGTPDTALTQKEIRKDMPLPGQANDHSNDAFAKRGDDTNSTSTAN